MANAVEVRGVSKRFRIHHDKSLKERVVTFGRSSHEEFFALSDINLDIEVGSTVGLLGHNGSGKSTLLKCVAGILSPTTGTIMFRSSISLSQRHVDSLARNPRFRPAPSLAIMISA